MCASDSTVDSDGAATCCSPGSRSGSDCSTSSRHDDAAVRVPRRIRNRIALDHLSQVKELERRMLPMMSKGTKSQRDESKAAFEASLSALRAQYASDLQDALVSATPLSHRAVEKSACRPDGEQVPPRSLRVAFDKRDKSSRKRADYLSRRIYKEMRTRASARDPEYSSVVKMIENSRANLEYPVDQGRTLLLAAADLGAHEVVASLLCAGARVDARDEEQRCALVLAASRNSCACVDVILDHLSSGNCVCSTRSEVQRCMQLAIRFGSVPIAQSLLRHVRARVWYAQFLDWSVIAAATVANAHILLLLLDCGANANAADSLKRSALMHVLASKVDRVNIFRNVTNSRIHRSALPASAFGCC